MNRRIILILVLVELGNLVSGQSIMPLDAVIDSITASHPVVKMYNNEIRSMDEAAKGWYPIIQSCGRKMIWVEQVWASI